MKSKAELLRVKNDKKEKEFQDYVKAMENVIKRNYPDGLDFDECPHCERIVSYEDIDIYYYTRIEKILIEAIQSTEGFKKIAKELTDNGYKFEFKSHVIYPHSRAEWEIDLIIR